MPLKLKNLKKYILKKITIDPLYQSYWYSKFINKLMLNGKKHLSEKLVSKILLNLKLKYNVQPIFLILTIITKLKPILGIIQKRLGKEWKPVPIPINPRKQLIISLKWITNQIKRETQSTLILRTLKTFQKFFKRHQHKNAELMQTKNNYYYNMAKNRVNLRYRWK